MRARKLISTLVLGVLGAVPAVAMSGGDAAASSHREAPFITKMPKVDSTDFYMFRSYEAARLSQDYVTLIASYQPFEDPFGGPNYFTMDPEALYEIHIDNNADAKEDLTFQFRFTNALAGGEGAKLDIGPAGAKKSVAIPLINATPGTTGDANLNVQESFTAKIIRGDRRTSTDVKDIMNAAGNATTFRKPVDNIGVKSFGGVDPATGAAVDANAYKAYADAHVYTVNIPGCTAGTGKIFVGQRQESFAVNIGPIFDLVDAPAGVITNPAARAAVTNPIGKKSVTSIAVELPSACVKGTGANGAIIGGWQTASVRQARAINPQATYGRPSREGGAWAQVSRLGMPLVNEVVIGIKDKDRWNSSVPSGDTQFLDYVTHPTLPALIEALFGPTVAAPTLFPRADLVAAFLTGITAPNAAGGPDINLNTNGATAEYQRLNLGLPPTAIASQKPFGAAGCVDAARKIDLTAPNCDPAGFPNGRRPIDDVVDVELRVAMGVLIGDPTKAVARDVPFHDAVAQEATTFLPVFPYLNTPLPGAVGGGANGGPQ